MNRLTYLLSAQTRYSLHSPWMFDFYNQVLMPVVEGSGSKIEKTAYKIVNRQGYRKVSAEQADPGLLQWIHRGSPKARIGRWDKPELLIVGQRVPEQIKVAEGGMVMWISPHRDKEREQRWETVCRQMHHCVNIDMYDFGLIIFKKELHPQKFVLR